MDNKNLYHPIGSHIASLFTIHTYTGQDRDPQLSNAHFHRDLEFILVIEGSATVLIEQKKYEITAEESALIHPFQAHSVHVSGQSLVLISTCSVRYIPSLNVVLAGQEAKNPVFRLSEEVRAFILRRLRPSFGDRFRQSVLTRSQEFIIKTAFYAIGCDYIEQVELVAKKLEARSVTADVAQYIAKHFTENITLRDVAKQLGYNYQYLSRTLNKTININFKQLLNQYRMEYAVELLIKTDRPIIDISYTCGFQSLRSFYRVCQEMFGAPPNMIRMRE